MSSVLLHKEVKFPNAENLHSWGMVRLMEALGLKVDGAALKLDVLRFVDDEVLEFAEGEELALNEEGDEMPEMLESTEGEELILNEEEGTLVLAFNLASGDKEMVLLKVVDSFKASTHTKSTQILNISP